MEKIGGGGKGGAKSCGRVKKSFSVHEICLGMGNTRFFLTREEGIKKKNNGF